MKTDNYKKELIGFRVWLERELEMFMKYKHAGSSPTTIRTHIDYMKEEVLMKFCYIYDICFKDCILDSEIYEKGKIDGKIELIEKINKLK